MLAARTVDVWLYSPEDKGPGNPAKPADPNHKGTAEGALPLPADVVGLVRHGRRRGADRARGDQEHAEVAHGDVAVEAHEARADDGQEHVPDDDRAPEHVAVPQPARGVHDDGGEDVGRRRQDLGLSRAEAHVVSEDDGEEEGQGFLQAWG